MSVTTEDPDQPRLDPRVRPAAQAPAQAARPDPVRAGRGGRQPAPSSCPCWRTASGSRSCAARRAGGRARRAGRGAAAPAAAEPAGAAGDRPGGAQRDPLYAALGLPPLRAGPRLPTDVLEHILGLYGELRRKSERGPRPRRRPAPPTPSCGADSASRATTSPRSSGSPPRRSTPVGYPGTGALSQRVLLDIAAHFGFTVHYVQDLPPSVRSVTDLRNRRIYLEPEQLGMPRPPHDPAADPRPLRARPRRAARLRRLPAPAHRGQLLRRRRARCPSRPPVPLPARGQGGPGAVGGGPAGRVRRLLRDGRAPLHQPGDPPPRPAGATSSATTRAARSTRRTRTTGWCSPPTRRGRSRGSGCAGSGRGGRCSRSSTSRSTTSTRTRPRAPTSAVASTSVQPEGAFAITLGVPYRESRWFRGRETQDRTKSHCPTRTAAPPAGAAGPALGGIAWPSPRANSHVLAALPPGSFPGVDEADVYTFLDRHAEVDGP